MTDAMYGPMDTWLSSQPGRTVLGKHLEGASVVELREHGRLVTAGMGKTLAEAIAHALNNAFALEWADETEVAS
jgi:hypothetical protein